MNNNQLAVSAGIDVAAGLKGEQRSENVWNLIAQYLGKINQLVEEYGPKFNDEMKFIERCETKIEDAAKTFDPNRGDFDSRAHWVLNQAVREFIQRRSSYKKRQDSFDYLTSNSEMDAAPKTMAHFNDENENIEKNVQSEEFTNEIIDGYGDDEKRTYILERWAESGKIKHTELGREMVEVFGGTENAHTTFIKRFRKDMQTALA